MFRGSCTRKCNSASAIEAERILTHMGREERWFWPVVGLIAVVAVALRVLTFIGYVPADLSHPDTASYVHAAAGGLFSNPYRPAGYAVLLRLLHGVSRNLRFTILVQHAMGLATAVGVYLVCRLTGARRAIALVPAALVAWSGDQLLLEHAVLSDALFIAGLVLACYLALRILDSADPLSRRYIGLLVATSAIVALLGLVRTVGVALVPVFLVWLLVVAGPPWRHRVIVTGIALIACLVPILTYAAVQQRATGVFGISRFSGWPLYARVAPFADCRDFTPPSGTASLCESGQVSGRQGPEFYLWNPRSPARRAFGFPPAHGGELTQFALAAIEHQPLSYIHAVARDLVRYVDPPFSTNLVASSSLALNQRFPTGEALDVKAVRGFWSDTRIQVHQPIMDFLEGWRHVFRIHGALIALTAVLALVAIVVTPDARTRQALSLLVAFSAVLFVVPAGVSEYAARYGVPGAVLLLIAGARGAEILAARAARRWSERSSLAAGRSA
jgi:hypothetical protein